MLKKLSNSLFSRFALLILAFTLFHPSILALTNEGEKGDNKTTETAEKKNTNNSNSSVDLSTIILRLERAEAEAKAAREAANTATARATELEKQVVETNRRLQETEAELNRVKVETNSLVSSNKPKVTKAVLPQNENNQGQQEEEFITYEDDDQLTLNSVNDRVSELKDLIDVHEKRLQDSSRLSVETAEHFNVKLSGTLLFNTYYNTAGTDDPPTGLYLLGGKNISLENGANFGATIRQTQLGFSFFAPKIGDWRLSGDLQLDFFGGNPPVYNGRAFSPLRLRIARAKLESGRFAFIVGQDDPIVTPLNPTSLAQVGFPALAESGNLWSWTPQAKVAYRLVDRENERFTIEGGILAPYNGQTNTEFQFETRPDAGERSRMPAFETRFSYQRGDLASAPTNAYLAFDPQPFQVGIGVHYGRHLAVPERKDIGRPGVTINSVAVTGDYIIPLGNKMTLTGEVFWGRSLGGLGGAIVQGIVFPIYGSRAIGVRSRGGWAQLQVRPINNVAIHFAYGLDDPYNEDLAGTRFDLAAGTSRANNRTFSGNILYRFRSNFIISTEYRFMQTYFTTEPSKVNNHINVGFGYSF
ncbi:MAG: hypothetical protein IPK14_05335 [Blastocatellia bacterium]|nr:hypothetical protein [Blastocatellia bacterium]MBN8723307.1 hypothetical protein [Acidobacteriota bacterium]